MTDDEPVVAAPIPPTLPGPAPIAEPVPLVRPIEVVAIGTIVVLDQLTKFLIKATIPLYSKREVIPNLLDFTHVQNSGAAFGLLNATEFPFKSVVMIGIAAVALIAISMYARQLGPDERLSRYGLVLILGGAFGNLIDRAIAGYVVDFVDVYWGEIHFWAFNVADAAISVGAILVLLDMIGIGRQHAPRPL